MHDDAYEKQQLAEEGLTFPHLPLVDLCMESWASRWMILRSGRIGCVACEGEQSAAQAWLPFSHDPGCSYGYTAPQPWLYLRAHLMHIPRERQA